MKFKSILASVCFGTGTLLSFSVAAHAVTSSLSAGTSGSPNNQGTFSTVPGTTTINFNSASSSLLNNTNTYTFTDSGITVTYTWTNPTPSTRILANLYAPPNPTGDIIVRKPAPSNNTSRYLSVQAQDVTITFSAPMKYFGLNWGYADTGTLDSVSFFNGDDPLDTFKGDTVFGSQIGKVDNVEPSTYVNFMASGNQTFNRVVLSNSGSSSAPFESDNHAYRQVPFGFSPGLGIVVLGACGAVSQLKNQVKKRKVFGSMFSHN
jgi:hypothetical protein